jgi:DNA-binding CsgD family transcriptional regulator
LRGADRWPFDLARIRFTYGEHLRRLGAVDAARGQLNEALDAFRTLEASPLIARSAGQLRGASEAVVGIGSPREPLTSQEERIAALAASGLTNRDIAARMHLSARTVAGHLHQVFHKTGVTSRAWPGRADRPWKTLGRVPGSEPALALSGCGRGAR